MLAVGIKTCGENPMDINLFLGHWKDGRRYKRKSGNKKEDNMPWREKIQVFFYTIGKMAADIRGTGQKYKKKT